MHSKKKKQINSCHPLPTSAHLFLHFLPCCCLFFHPNDNSKIYGLKCTYFSKGWHGASVTLLSQRAYSALKAKFPNFLQLQKSNVTLPSVQGSILHVAGTVALPISLAPNSDIFNIQFFVTSQFAFPCDGLLGLDSLGAHDISVHPKRRAIFSSECFHPAMDVNFPFLL